MNLKSKVFVSCAVGAIVTVYVLGDQSSAMMVPPAQLAPQIDVVEALSLPIEQPQPDKILAAVVKTVPTTTSELQCISQATFDNDPRHQQMKDYYAKEYYFGTVDYVNYLDESQLLSLAGDDNVRAMYVLGMNYRWHSQMNTFVSPHVKPEEEARPDYRKRPFDAKMMAKARYWFEQAALNGRYNAILEIAISFHQEKNRLDKKQPDYQQRSQELDLKSRGYFELHNWLTTEANDEDLPELPVLDEQQQHRYEQLLQKMQSDWIEGRLARGYDTKIDLNLPPAFYQLKALRQSICPVNG